MDMSGWAKLLMLCGVILFLIGVILYGLARLNFPLFHLPGDIFIEKGNFRFAFPFVSCILLSILLSIILNIFRK